ncbi:MAG: hypothetical protein AB8H47_06675 [Bacteroidia bacterium]
MNFSSIEACVSCFEQLSEFEIHEFQGFCPKCGFDSESLDCKTISVKVNRLTPWWQFWKKPVYETLENLEIRRRYEESKEAIPVKS